MLEQFLELLLRRRRVGAKAHPQNHQAVESARHLLSGQLDPEPHAPLDGLIEVDQPLELIRHHELAVLEPDRLVRRR